MCFGCSNCVLNVPNVFRLFQICFVCSKCVLLVPNVFRLFHQLCFVCSKCVLVVPIVFCMFQMCFAHSKCVSVVSIVFCMFQMYFQSVYCVNIRLKCVKHCLFCVLHLWATVIIRIETTGLARFSGTCNRHLCRFFFDCALCLDFGIFNC